jgi:hypothetical protein
MLARLIYVSEAAKAMKPGDLEGILTVARQKNRLIDVSGMLLYDHDGFLQVLEGDALALSGLFLGIGQDPRHKRIKLLEFRELAQRQFGDWAMSFASASKSNRQIFLRHTAAGRFLPYDLNAASALAVLLELSSALSPSSEVATPAG